VLSRCLVVIVTAICACQNLPDLDWPGDNFSTLPLNNPINTTGNEKLDEMQTFLKHQVWMYSLQVSVILIYLLLIDGSNHSY
jgi:hypothetical protein